MRGGNLAAYGHADLPFERLVEVLNPARSLSRHPLFQVMLAFEAERGGGGLELPGLAVRPQPVATASAKFDLSLGLIERRAADGQPAGIDGVAGIRQRPVRRCDGWRRLASGWCGCWRAVVADGSRALGRLDDPGRGRARHHPARLERHRAFSGAGLAAPARRRAMAMPVRRTRDGMTAARDAA